MLYIKYHVYMCHPETCCHDNHYPWWVEYDDGVLLDNFDTKEDAVKYCEKIKRRYTIVQYA